MSLPKNSRSFTFSWFLLVLMVLVLTLNFLATSYSACATLTYQTAYLKANYAAEFHSA